MMETGMLWFDSSSKPLVEKVKLAAQYFQKKYGRTPDLCLVHPSMVTEHDVVPFYGKEIHVRPYRSVLPGHLWIGIDDEPEYVQTSKTANAAQERERAEVNEIQGAAMQMGQSANAQVPA